jgi:glycyl-tRNA synthetase (class II)
MDLMEKLVSLCKRRGYIFPSSEIYGGLNGCWDYGPLGVELKRNIKDAWWQDMIAHHDETDAPIGAPGSFGMVGLDCSILMNPTVWEASGHIGGFNDPMVDCRETRNRYRAIPRRSARGLPTRARGRRARCNSRRRGAVCGSRGGRQNGRCHPAGTAP